MGKHGKCTESEEHSEEKCLPRDLIVEWPKRLEGRDKRQETREK
jgi:hypothetical protein